MKNDGAMSSTSRCWTRQWLSASSLALLLTALVLLSSGCASNWSNKLAPGVKPAAIPPLPQAGVQPKRSEKFSASVSRDIESWEKKLTGQETPASPASERMTPFPAPPTDPKL
jgi:hypothetical protein